MKEFGELPNVRIAKTEAEACQMLKKVKDEMDRRFEYLEKTGNKEIIPVRDKIVVGIDEASILYSKVKANATKAHLINTAREYTDELAKLARAAGIHLIFATQKVSKETIDTKVQENLGGRVCFRMNTMTNSVTVLGNKKAFELPEIKGRAVWASGNDFLEIQAPFLEDEELKSEIEILQEKFSSNYPCFRPMMDISEGEVLGKKTQIPNGNYPSFEKKRNWNVVLSGRDRILLRDLFYSKGLDLDLLMDNHFKDLHKSTVVKRIQRLVNGNYVDKRAHFNGIALKPLYNITENGLLEIEDYLSGKIIRKELKCSNPVHDLGVAKIYFKLIKSRSLNSLKLKNEIPRE